MRKYFYLILSINNKCISILVQKTLIRLVILTLTPTSRPRPAVAYTSRPMQGPSCERTRQAKPLT